MIKKIIMAGIVLISSTTVPYGPEPYAPIADFTKPNKITLARQQSAASEQAGLPTRLIIPKLNISTTVEHIGLTKNGAVGVPASAKTVSWFTQGARPGQAGNALISGHSGIWANGTHSIFDKLPTLKIGDTFYIADDKGVQRAFEVVGTKVYSKDATVPELFAASNTPRVNIITCYGTYLPKQKTYDRRWVVFAQLVA